jgi:O-antigen/teichoic acid export membrane protein
MPRTRLCILSLASVHQDGRVLRQIEYTARQYDVTVVEGGPFAYSILNNPEVSRVYGKVFSVYSLLARSIATVLSLAAPLLLHFLTTPAYYGAAAVVPWLVLAYVAMGATYVVALSSIIVKKPGPVALSVFVGTAVNTALNFTLIPRLGKDGAAMATFAACQSTVIYLYFVSQRIHSILFHPLDAVACLGLSWLLIAVDHLALPPAGLWVYALRTGMCLLFIPLAFGLRIVSPAHVQLALDRIGSWHLAT